MYTLGNANEQEGLLPDKAAEFYARARNESDVMTQSQYETLASQYSRLAKAADRDATVEGFTSHRYPESGTKQ